jgi:hypothetical protein
MERKKNRSTTDRRKENILQLLDSMDQSKLGVVHGIILTAMLVQQSAENKVKVTNGHE